VLAKNGFQVTNLAGGFRGWREANSSSSDAPPNKA
jgi:rhodanese-related sulfurtransferase